MELNAPEKIYLQEPTKVRTEKKYDNDVEYIRTDAFIEKACEWLADNARAFDEGDIYNAEDLIEYFRKYMEGE